MGIIQKQGIWSAIITYTGIAAGFVSLLIVQPRFLSPEEVGLTRVLYSFCFLISTVLPLSAGNITSRFFPRFRNPQKRHFGFLGFILLFPILGIVLGLPVLLLLKPWFLDLYRSDAPLFVEYFPLSFPLSAALALSLVLNNYLFAAFRPLFASMVQEVLTRIGQILLILIYAAGWLNQAQFVWGFVGIYVLQTLLLMVYALRYAEGQFRFHRNNFNLPVLREFLQYGLIVFLAGIASMAIKLVDAIVLAQFVPLALVGVYGIAAYIPIFIEAPVNALDKVANARIAHSWEHNDLQNIRHIYHQSSRFLFLLGSLLFLGIVWNAQFVFEFLPPAYHRGIPIVYILSLSALFNLLTGSNTAIIFTSDRFLAGALGLFGVALLNLILLYAFIPQWGIEGAAWATCISSFAYNAYKYLYIWIRFRMQPFDRKTFYILACLLSTALVVSFVPVVHGAIWNMLIRSSIIVGVFGLSTWYFGLWNDLPLPKSLQRKLNRP